MAEYIDYNYSPENDGGKFLNLKNKGDKIVIRIASKPVSYFVHWIDQKPIICPNKAECELCQKSYPATDSDQAAKEKRKQQFVWLVINREDKQAYIYKAGYSVFSQVAEYGLNPEWGDPTNYDVQITRTEIKPMFYAVMALPSSLSVKLTKQELADTAKLSELLDFTTTQNRKDSEKDEETVDDAKLPF